mmetsp:Transcript_11610/g.11251  ORF Transcript_11610/g.11251 Transcript_11610/m.11251 type:complete len:150 (-) Transcript_11610:12-461(-)
MNEHTKNNHTNSSPHPPFITPTIENRKLYQDLHGGKTKDLMKKNSPVMMFTSKTLEGDSSNGKSNMKSRKYSDISSNSIDYHKDSVGSDKGGEPPDRPSVTTYPFPSTDLSSRVIVATDLLGFIRVFVRSGRQNEDDKNIISGLKQMKL